MAVKNLYLRIEQVADYSPVAPMEKVAPPMAYKRDCMFGHGHESGSIPEAEVLARRVTGLVYREYEDPGFLVPVVRKLVPADINEPVWSRRMPGVVLYAVPGDTLKVTVRNDDIDAHSLRMHGLEHGIDSDGSWPFGTNATDGNRSDEICPGGKWTYTFEVRPGMVGAWPFHDGSRHATASIERGLFGGIIVSEVAETLSPVLEMPATMREQFEALEDLLPSRPAPTAGRGGMGRRPLGPPGFVPGTVNPRPALAERRRPGHDVVAARDTAPPRDPPASRKRAHAHTEGHDHEHDEQGDCAGCRHGCARCRDFDLLHSQALDLLGEWELIQLVAPEPPAEPSLPGSTLLDPLLDPELLDPEMPDPELPATLHVPLFFHVIRDDEATPAFDSGDLEEHVGTYELTFPTDGHFRYFCRFHPSMEGTVEVAAGGPTTATVHIVDTPTMGFSPATVTVAPGGTVEWQNLSDHHHTVTSTEASAMATHCLNGRGFAGNTPTVVGRSGQRVRWYLFNLDVAEPSHTFHPHGGRWHDDGPTDVRSLAPAEAAILDTEIPPVLVLDGPLAGTQDATRRPVDAVPYDLVGDFAFHCHDHHHMANGMVGLVRAKQRVWLTPAMANKLARSRGLPLDDGRTACTAPPADRCDATGRWELVPGDPQVTFMHSMLVPWTDKVLYWGYTRADQSRLWDYSTPEGAYETPSNQPADVVGTANPVADSDLWSAEHEYLDTPTGAMLIHGGANLRRSFVFEPATLSWGRVQDTTDDRYYATTFSLEDGRVITMFGSNTKTFEIYEHGVGWSPPIATPPEFDIYHYYPWAYLLPDGRVVIAGHQNPARRFDPLAPVADPAETFPTLHGSNRSVSGEGGTSVLLPLRPPDYAPRVLIAGGNQPTVLRSAELLDLSAPAPAWAPLPDMLYARNQVTGVLLPTGEVLVAGGTFEASDGGPAEIIDAESTSPAWRPSASLTFFRAYHSGFILLRDGTVLGGGDPFGAGPGPTPHERFFPWYADLARPEVTGVPTAVGYGEHFSVSTPDAADAAEVLLMRPGAMTHGFNMTQRAVELVITAQTASSLDVVSPPNARVAPPGPYLLFVLTPDGVPSVARWIRVTP